MSFYHEATIAVLIGMLAVALYTDWRWTKIFNNLTLPCIATGIILGGMDGASHGFHGALMGFLSSFAGAGIVVVLYLVLAPAMGIGGGDMKLMMAVGALMGLRFAIGAILITAILGGVMALIVMARHKVMVSTTRSLLVNLYSKAVFRTPINLATGSSGIKFRYSLAIAGGTALAFALWR